MSHAELAKTIDDAFEKRDGIGPATKGAVRDAVEAALDLLDRGIARVAEKGANGDWRVNQWLKKAVLLSFRLNDMSRDSGRARHRPPGGTRSPPSSTAGTPPASRKRASAPCRTAWCAAPPTSRPASC